MSTETKPSESTFFSVHQLPGTFTQVLFLSNKWRYVFFALVFPLYATFYFYSTSSISSVRQLQLLVTVSDYNFHTDPLCENHKSNVVILYLNFSLLSKINLFKSCKINQLKLKTDFLTLQKYVVQTNIRWSYRPWCIALDETFQQYKAAKMSSSFNIYSRKTSHWAVFIFQSVDCENCRPLSACQDSTYQSLDPAGMDQSQTYATITRAHAHTNTQDLD